MQNIPAIKGAIVTDTVSAAAPAVLQEYYRVLIGGARAFGERQDLRVLLSDHLDFTGSLAGHHPAATEELLRGGVIGTFDLHCDGRDRMDEGGQ